MLISAGVAVLLLVLGNLLLTFGDIAIKSLGSGEGLFQYLLLRQLISITLLLPLWWRLKPERRAPGDLRVHFLRAHLSVLGACAALFALIHLELATANVIFYAAPLVTLLLARFWLAQPLSRKQMLQTLLGFVGVVVALRPDQFHWAAGAALVVAFTLAFFNLLVHKLPKHLALSATVLWSNLCALPTTALLAVLFWQPINAPVVWLALIVAGCSAGYQALATKAYRAAAAGQIAIAEYSGLVFAVIAGVFWFDEALDSYTLFGLLLIVLPMCLQAWQQRRAVAISAS